jgi:hypothetical protein
MLHIQDFSFKNNCLHTVEQVRVLATVKNSALNAVFPVTLRSQFPNLGQPKNSYRNSIILFTSDNRPVPYISLKITPKMWEMPFQRHKLINPVSLWVWGATTCPPDPQRNRVYFNVQFYTKCAVLNPFVQFLNHKCAVTKLTKIALIKTVFSFTHYPCGCSRKFQKCCH